MNKERYYARPGQFLSTHLIEVAEQASVDAAAFHSETNAYYEGLCHDAGKNSNLFDAVLNGEIRHVNHSVPGVVAFLLALRAHGITDIGPYLPIAFCIASHHGGLQAGPTGIIRKIVDDIANHVKTDNAGRLYSITGLGNINQMVQELKNCGVDFNGLPKPSAEDFTSHCSDRSIAKMLYTRMLYSCLVDGDYSSSSGKVPKAVPFDVDAALQSLAAYRKQIILKNQQGDPVMNELRNTVFAACSHAGKTPIKAATLTAPTGAGKTLALMEFALEQIKTQGKRRSIIVLPFLSIIDQNAEIYRKIVPQLLEIHSQSPKCDPKLIAGDCVSRWESPVILTTAVQFFETLFANEGTELRKLHQFANSVIVFDEAQSLPPHLAKATIQTMESLVNRYGCSVLFSTATQPAFDILPGTNWHPTEIMDAPFVDSKRWHELLKQSERVSIAWELDHKTSFETLADKILIDLKTFQSVCVIVNRRDHAKELFAALSKIVFASSIKATLKVYLISSELCAAHRKKILKSLQARLEQHLPCVLISTQCIEAGVDVSFQKMYRALAPLDALVQAAGRCCRHDTRGQKGQMIVFIPDKQESSLYPASDAYKQGAHETFRLWMESIKGGNAPKTIDEAFIRSYYKAYFLFADSAQADKKLQQAISEMDFPSVAKQYHLIDETGATIVIPHGKSFDTWKSKVMAVGLTKKDMRKSAPYTISIYNKDVLAHCEPIPLQIKGRADWSVPSQWYVLKSSAMYDWKQQGLTFC